MKRLAFLTFLSICLISFVSASSYTNNNSWMDDFKDASINSTFWTSWSNQNMAGAGTATASVTETTFMELTGYLDTHFGYSGSAGAILMGNFDYKNNLFYQRFDFTINGTIGIGDIRLDLNDGTKSYTIQSGADYYGKTIHTFTNAELNGIPKPYYVIIAPEGIARIYNSTGMMEQVAINTSKTTKIQFTLSMSTNNVIVTDILDVYNFTASQYPSVSIILKKPDNGALLVTSPTSFNASFSQTLLNITNYTLYIWQGSSIKSTTTIITNLTNSSLNVSTSITTPDAGNYLWNYLVCGIPGCQFAESNFSLISSYNNVVGGGGGGSNGGGSLINQLTTPTQSVICEPAYPPLETAWTNFKASKTWANFAIVWHAWFDWGLCKSGASLVPV